VLIDYPPWCIHSGQPAGTRRRQSVDDPTSPDRRSPPDRHGDGAGELAGPTIVTVGGANPASHRHPQRRLTPGASERQLPKHAAPAPISTFSTLWHDNGT
jgi:hypothetical protein